MFMMCTLRKRHRITRLFSLQAVFLFWICCLNPAIVAEPVGRQLFSRLITNGSVSLNDESGRPLLAYQADEVLVPASIVKIYTALAAFEILGEGFRFKTGFYQDGNGNLGIKGWGDPQLISEEIHQIAEKLKKSGILKVRQIKLDQTAFAKTIPINGRSNSLNPYDAVNGALIVNFNTLFLGRYPDGRVYSAEPVTPLTPLSRELGKKLRPGTRDRFNLSTRPANATRYAGELFGEIFKRHAIALGRLDSVQTEIDENWSLVFTHHNTLALDELVRGLLKYSNNLIANQIYLVAGAEKKGYPATLAKAKTVFQDFFREQFPDHASRTKIDEASGISRDNRMSAKAMMAILERFRPWAHLLDKKKGALVKSGTLTGVYNYAGYIKTEKGYRPFVIFLNQPENQRDRILRLLLQY